MLRKRFLNGLVSGGMGFLLKILIMLALMPMMIHLLGVQQYGVFLLFLGFSEMSLLIANGLTTGFTQRYSECLGSSAEAHHPHSRLQLLTNGRWMFLLLALLTLAIGLPVLPWLLQTLLKRADIPFERLLYSGQLVLAYSSITILTRYGMAIFRSHCLQSTVNWIETGQNILESALSVIILSAGAGLTGVFMGRLLLCGAVFFFSLLLLWRKESLFQVSLRRWGFHWHTFREVLGISLFAMIQYISVFIAHRMDEVIIAAYLTLVDVTCFSLVVRVLGQISALSLKLLEGLFPLFARLNGQNENGQNEDSAQRSGYLFLRSSALIHYLVLFLLTLVMGGFGEIIHYLGHGEINLNQAYSLAWIACVITWSGSIQIPANNYLFSSGLHRFQTFSSMITALCNLGLSIVLIQKIGLPGVILGTLIPHLLQHHLVTINMTIGRLRLKRLTFFHQVYLKTLPPLLAGALALYLIRMIAPLQQNGLMPWPYLLVAMAVSTLISLSVWFVTCLDPEEHALIRQGLRGILRIKMERGNIRRIPTLSGQPFYTQKGYNS